LRGSQGNVLEKLEYDSEGILKKRKTEEYNEHFQILERKGFETKMRFGEPEEIPISRESHKYTYH